ncbi:ABC transporter permease [Sphaerochaeta sp.]|uniref:ABC transporter permease n=1 Tax=Sphaerochaeta sp. TaxID=1972642 RepID=UPI003FA7D06D
MFLKRNKQKEAALNEFDQVVEGNSLGKDAWRRLKKNKMAVLGMIVVIIYSILAATAPLLPIYPYDQIILDHQHLRPTLTKTAGDLMMETKLKDLYFKAWRAGTLHVTEAQSQQIKDWIADNETNRVWQFCYDEGQRQSKAGTFTFSDADKKTIDRLQQKIDTEFLINVDKMLYTDLATGKTHNLAKMSYPQILSIYANLLGVDAAVIEKQTTEEINNQVLNSLKASTPDLSDEEYSANLEIELETMGKKGVDAIGKTNLLGKIKTTITRSVERDLKKEIADGNAQFPIKRQISVNDSLKADISATKKHDRHYYLGTDYSGRDMLSRIIYGGQVSIAIGLVGTLTSVLIGIFLGAIAGYAGGKIDFLLMRLVDIMYGLPYMLLVIIFMAIFGRNIMNLFVALAMVSWLTIARMVRGQIMSLKNSEYVEAARSMGASTGRIIFRHMVPNSLSVIIVYSTLRVPAFIMQESFLSFLGLGVQAPYASWGSLVGDAVNGMTLYPWKLIFPAIAMTIFLFAMNFFGDGLRDAFDPQSKNQL